MTASPEVFRRLTLQTAMFGEALPDSFDAACVEPLIRAHQGNRLCQSLRHNQAVERIAMVERELRQQRRVSGQDWQQRKVIDGQLRLDERLVGLGWESSSTLIPYTLRSPACARHLR